MTKEYTHELNTEVRSISGGYCLDEEGIIEMDGRQVLYVLGNAVVDSSCCGVYGCRFAVVPGYVVKWKYKTTEDGIPVSEIEPIPGEQTKQELTRYLKTKEGVTQVQFW